MKALNLIVSGKVVLMITLLCSSLAGAWDNEVTHPDLSQFASVKSFLGTTNCLKNIGLSDGLVHLITGNAKKQEIYKWLRDGADLEDAGNIVDLGLGRARSYNHFHNPLNPWNRAGLNDYYTVQGIYPPVLITYPMIGESALLWAQDQAYQNLYERLERDQTWQATRNNYYSALTGTTEARRQELFARTFKGLGHQMHLIQDMSVPAHVRNDAHVGEGIQDSLLKINIAAGDSYFETWSKTHPDKINGFASKPLYPQVDLTNNPGGLIPITQFYDTDQYVEGGLPEPSLSWGLSEYTNANFVSDDTIFTEQFSRSDRHYFPHPKYTGQAQCYERFDQDIAPNKRRTYWRKKCAGEIIDHFVTVGPWFKYLPTWNLQRLDIRLDGATHTDYTQKLVPRAVGYSAGLLNYFFRGDISVDSCNRIVNNSEEDMSGRFGFYYDNENGERFLAWEEYLEMPAKGKSVRINFATPQTAKEPGKYMLVFRGRMGNEEDAVAGRIVTLRNCTR